MFQRILAWIKDWISKMLKPDSLKSSLQIDVAVSPLMSSALQEWSLMYANQSTWLNDKVSSLNLTAAISAEVAKSVTIEMVVEIAGSPRADFLASQLAPVLTNTRTNTEHACAKGGLVLKPYISGNGLAVDAVQADMFYPVAFDSNRKMTACVFADQKTRGRDFYTRLEYHALQGTTYLIRNTVWKSSTRETLGNQIPLANSPFPEWQELQPEAFIENVEKPLFGYFAMPFANNIDVTSPLGVSIFSRAAHAGNGKKCLIQQADEIWSSLLWEMEASEMALYVDPMAFGKTADGKPILPHKRLHRMLDLSGNTDKQGFYQEWAPTIREQNYINALDAVLKKIEFVCGLSYGILSDPKAIALTATEIRSSKQTYYANVADIQKALQTSLDDTLYAMDVWTTLGNLAPRGNYAATYTFDDSIVADDATQYQNDSQSVTMNAMPKYVFLMRNYNLDEVTARKWVEEAKAESPAPSFFPGGLDA